MRRSADQIDKLAIDRSCRIISLTENLWKIIHGSVEDYFSTLKDKIDREVSVIQTIETASDMLEEGIHLLSKVINRQFDDQRF